MPVFQHVKAETKRWLARASEDLDHAEFLVENERPSPGAFHAQQAAEKAFKALLVGRTDEFPRVQDLVRLAELANAPDPLRDAVSLLSPAYLTTRYPDVNENLDIEEGQNLLDIAKKVITWVKASI